MSTDGTPKHQGKPKIRHLAIWTKNPDELAAFYSAAFDMVILNRTKTATYLTDGYINLALLHHRPEIKAPLGINHFGFVVEDAADVVAKIEALGVAPPVLKPAERIYAEHGGKDSDGNMFDISEHGYAEAEDGTQRAKR